MLTRLRRSSLAAVVAFLAWSGSVQAAGIVRITEVMSNALTLGTMDWWEITNYGDSAVDISGWRMDDNGFVFGSSVALVPYSTTGGPAWTSVDPGESVMFMETASGSTSVQQFQSLWNLGTAAGNVRNPKLGYYVGSGMGVGLSSGGDGVILFDALGTEINRVSFGAATAGSSFYWSYDSAGVLATSPAGTVSNTPFFDAYTVTSTSSQTNTGSPGVATVTSPVVSLYWTGNGSALGGSGTWNSSAARWSPTESPVTAGQWADGKGAIFSTASGTVTVTSAVSPLAMAFTTSGFTLASGSGSVTACDVTVAAGAVATIATRITGSSSLSLNAGTLRLGGTNNDYSGFTSVIGGTLQLLAANVIPDGSRLAVSRFAQADFNGLSDTVAGLQGLGTVRMGSTVTVNITGTSDARLDGPLSGNGDLVIDSAGTGVQRLNTSQTTFNVDFAVKDYVGKTLINRGGLGVDRTAVPIATTEVTVEAAGQLLLSPNNDPNVPDQVFNFGSNAALPVNLKGGLIGQGAGDDVELANRLDITGTSTVLIKNKTTPDPLNPSTQEFVFSGPLTGAAGGALKVLASDTTSGLAQSRAKFTSASDNTFAGTVNPGPSAVARFNGDYTQTAVVLEGGKVDGYGAVKSVTGSGIVSPDGTSGPDGILTVGTITPTAGMSVNIDLNVAGTAPDWATPTVSRNDVLRMTGSTPFTAPLASTNVVRLFVGSSIAPVTLSEGTSFQGGFFTTTDQQSAITGATYTTYVYGDGLGSDFEHGGSMYYTLANFNTRGSTLLAPAVTMVSATAGFADGTVSGYIMQTTFATPTATPTELTWYGNGVTPGGSGNWTTSEANWHDGLSLRTWAPGAKAIFSGSAAGTVTVGSGISADGGLDFTTGGYTLAGATLTLGGTTNNVNVATGGVTVTAPIAGTSGLTKAGAGGLALAAVNTLSGATVVQSGSLQVSNADAVAASAVTVQSGAALKIDSGVTMRSPGVTLAGGRLDGSGVTLVVNGTGGIAQLVIASGSVAGSPGLAVSGGGVVNLPTDRRQVIDLSSLSIDQASGGKLDIGKGRINVAAGGTTEGDLRADLIAGRSGGTFSGTSGIMTTGGKASPGSTNPVVGYRLLGSGSAIIAWAAYGDANLDGQVNNSDITLINNGQKYGKGSSTGATFAQGDFNFSGGVTFADITLINNSQVFNKGSYLPVAPTGLMGMIVGGHEDGFTFALESLDGFIGFDGMQLGPVAAVPEPAGWLCAVLGMAIMAASRRTWGPGRQGFSGMRAPHDGGRSRRRPHPTPAPCRPRSP